MQQHHLSITAQYNAQYLPEGKCELVESKYFQDKIYSKLFDLASNTEQMILEQGEKTYLISRITPTVYLEIVANRKAYNIGILKNVSKKLTEELRKNPLSPSND